MSLFDLRKIIICALFGLLVSCGSDSDEDSNSDTSWDVSGKAFMATILFGGGGFENAGNSTLEFFTDTYTIIGGTGVGDSNATYTIDTGGSIHMQDGNDADRTCLVLWSGAIGGSYSCVSQPSGSQAGSYTEIVSRTSAHAIERLSDNFN
ncbi:MAG: hypothetical protein ACI845_000832 [Gammaproteobacteria bacterium]|jgi:hypothetical protein